MFRTILFILGHPLNKKRQISALFVYLAWQLRCRIFRNPLVHQFTKNSKLLVTKGMTGATGNIYCGLHEFEEMGFLLHFLRPDDLFVDVGANIGSYTILAAAEVGAQVIAIEPIPGTAFSLQKNIELNDLSKKVTLLNKGLGAENSQLNFTADLDTVNHVATAIDSNVISVEVTTLDDVCFEQKPKLLKIDVEGFETEVLKGALHTLKNDSLEAIIIELNGSGSRFGYDEQWIHLQLSSHGFLPFRYEPFSRTLQSTAPFGGHNVIYLKHQSKVDERIKTARKIMVNNIEF